MTSLLRKCCQTIKRRKGNEKLPYTVRKKISSVQKNEWNHENFSGKPFHSTSYIAAILELEINPCTYRENIRNINLVVNGGKILSTQAAASTIKLGIQRVLECLFDDDRIEYPPVKISFVQSENDSSQIGELVYQVIPAAFTQALTQPLNCTINSIPLSSDTIFMKIKEQKKILRELNMKLDMQTNEHKESDNQEAEENENSTDFEW